MSDENRTSPRGGYEGVEMQDVTESEKLTVSWSLNNGIRLEIENDDIDAIACYHFTDDAQIERAADALLTFARRDYGGTQPRPMASAPMLTPVEVRLREALATVLREVEPLLEGDAPLPRGYASKMAARIEKLVAPLVAVEPNKLSAR
jgi:hypothetical protein